MPTHDFDYSNKTLFGIKNEASRYTWAGYFLFIIISSLLGDSAILIASIKYKAFKLHKVLIVIIKHIAVCDLMVTATDVLPKLVSIISTEWVLGTFLCYLTSYARYYFDLASILLICAMTTSKLVILKYPLRSGSMTSKRTHLVCVACWLVALTDPVMGLFVDWHDIYFSYRGYQCDYGYSSATWLWLKPFIALAFGVLPIALVIVTTIHLVAILRANMGDGWGRDKLKRRGIVTTVVTATVYCISGIPYMIFRIGESFISAENKSESTFHVEFYRLAVSLLVLNTVSNFYIYSLTVPSFRYFIWSRVQLSYQLLADLPIFTYCRGK